LGDTVALDSDGDLIPNETDTDDDGDGLTDTEEHALGTNLIKADSDGDGFSDFEEIDAGTSPLLASSFPGSTGLLFNTEFTDGEEPWIVHTNIYSLTGEWITQLGSWGGVYSVLDFVAATGDSEFTFYNLRHEPDKVIAEHLLFQEFTPFTMNLNAGDVIRFRGTASASSASESFVTQAFIRVLDRGFQKLPETAEIAIGPDPVSFELETTLGEETINRLQLGLLIEGPVWEQATITFSGLEGTINEYDTWAGYPIINAAKDVDTGDFLGWINVFHGDYVWCYAMDGWMYCPEANVHESGAWVYVPR
jgi:hypothetical protein